MGKNKGRKKKPKSEGISHLTTDTLLTYMQEKIDSFQYTEAQKYCQEALKRDPDNIAILEAAGSLCLELGEEDRAKHCYGRAITLSPEEGYSKYFTMAQLLSHQDSYQCYLKGIEVLSKVMNVQNDKEQESITQTPNEVEAESDKITNDSNCNQNGVVQNGIDKVNPSEESESDASTSGQTSKKSSMIHELSLAYCSIAELFMTDLCDEDDAENQCLKHIHKAIEIDHKNSEAYQHMASFLLVKQKKDEAKEYIKKSVEMWLPSLKAIDEDKAAPGTFDPIEPCRLSYHTRLSAARILIEVEEFESANSVLEVLLLENDETIDVWYLLGWNSYLQGDDHKSDAKYYLLRALKLEEHPSSDPELLNHIKELLEELKDVPKESHEEINEEDIDSSSSDNEEEVLMDVT